MSKSKEDETPLLSHLLDASSSATGLEASGMQPRVLELMRERHWTFFVTCLEDARTKWTWHDGDIEVEGDLCAEAVVVVNGNLRVGGSLLGTAGLLIVLGSLQAQNVMTSWSLAVVGEMNVAGLVYVHYNDHVFRAGDVLRARAFVVDDMDASYGKGKLEVEVHVSDQSFKAADAEAACRTLAPDLVSVEQLIEGIEEHDPDKPFLCVPLVPNADECYRRLREGVALFREEAPPPDLGAWIMGALTAGADGDLTVMRSFHGRDPLVDRIVDAFDEAASKRIPRSSARMRAAAADRAVLKPMGPGLTETLRETGGLTRFDGAAAHPELGKKIGAIQNSWTRSDCERALTEFKGKASIASQDVRVSGAVQANEPLVINGDLVVDGTLALSSGVLLVTGNVQATNLILRCSLYVLGTIEVAEMIAGRAGPDDDVSMDVEGSCTARQIFFDNVSAEYGAGGPVLAEGPEDEYAEWSGEESAAAHLALAADVVDFEALLENVYEDDEEFPPAEPALDFPAAWRQLRDQGTLLRAASPPVELAEKLLETLLAIRAGRPEPLAELRSDDPLIERIARVYG